MLTSIPRVTGWWLVLLWLLAGLALPASAQKAGAKKPAAGKSAASKTAPAKSAAKPSNGQAPGAAPPDSTAKVAPGKTAPIGVKYKLSTDPAVFPDDVRRLLEGVNNAQVTKTAQMFQATWSAGRFSASQQQRIIALAQQMVTRRYKAHPHYEQYFGSLVSAVNEHALSGSALDDLMTVFEKTMANDPPPAMPKLLAAVAQLLEQRMLFQNRTNSLKFTGGSFAFAYYDAENPAPAFGQPYAPKPKEVPKPVAPPEPAPEKPGTKATATAKKPAPKKKKKPAVDDWGDPIPAADDWGTPAPAPAKTATKKVDDWGEPVAAAPADDGWGTPVFDQPNPDADPASGLTPFAIEPLPVVSGAALVLRDVDFAIKAAFDSAGAIIQKTTGAVMLTTGQFVGAGGTYQWQPTPGNTATVTLGQYQFDVAKPILRAEGSTLDYPAVLEAPIDGVFEYRASRPGKRGLRVWPRFASFTNDARLKSLGDDVRYRGGFALAGARVSTSALDGSSSALTLFDRDSVRMRAQSTAFQLGDSLITAVRAAVTILQNPGDSITHPGAKFKYARGSHKLILTRGEGVYAAAPYTDSYHQLEIEAEMVSWDVRSPYVNFAMITAKNQVFAHFASKDYYEDAAYQRLGALAPFHPLRLLDGFSKERHTDTFYLIELSEARKIPPKGLHQVLSDLARGGFVDYTAANGQITIRPKLRHYVGAARGKTDYDHIIVNSRSSAGKNATLDLQTKQLLVRGVDRFNFAPDTVNVYVEPDSGLVRIDQNRNMKFNGRLGAGELTFVGSDFQFDYNGFWVDLNKIDSTIVRDDRHPKHKKKKGALDDDEDNKAPKMVLTNRGQRTSGRLYLNRPNNKSWRKQSGAFPSFESQSPAFISFNDQSVQGGAYDSTVYFEVPPFRLDSLNGKSKSPVGLKGIFHSGGIFPDFETEMKLQPDGSTGFSYQAPKEGLPTYGGKGQFFAKIKMDSQGLQGEGTLKVHDATLKGDPFVFYRDSAVAVGRSVTIAPSATTPRLAGKDYLMKWFAGKDSLTMTSQQDPFQLYGDTTVTLAGTATLTPAGLVGSGTLETPASTLAAENLALQQDGFQGRHSLFVIKGEDEKKPLLKARDARVDYHMKDGYAEFSPENEGSATTELTGVQYRTSLPGGKWDFKKKVVTLKAPEGGGLGKSYFVSTQPQQYGLRWPAAEATYDLESQSLRAKGVPYVTVGDARIQPDSLRVTIAPDGKMRRFEKAFITMDTLTRFHRLYDGQIQVVSRIRFTGSASYRYKAGVGDSTTIRFNEFRVDSAANLVRLSAAGDVSEATGKRGKKGKDKGTAQASNTLAPGLVTQARATVGEKEQVLVAPRVQYRGGVAIVSRQKGLINDGEGKLKFSSTPQASDWFAIRDSLDPNNLHFPIGGLKSADGTNLTTGIMRSDDTGKLYPLYVGVKTLDQDLPVFEVGGELAYNKPNDVFTLGNLKRDGFEVNEGNVMTFNGKNGKVEWRGTMRFTNPSPNFQIEGSGIGSGIPDSGSYDAEALLLIDAKMSEKALDIMGTNLLKSTPQHPRAVQLSDPFTSKLGDIIGSKGAKEFNNVKPGTLPPGLAKVSPKFNKAMVINEVKLKWSRKNRAWYSIGPINLSNVMGTNVNASLDGFIEIKRAPEGDFVELLVEADPNTWYHFKYANGTLLTWSSWEAYNNEVTSKQPKEDYNVAMGYGVWSGDDFQKDQFRAWFIKQYRSEEERRKLRRAAVSAPAPKPQDTFQADPAASGEADAGGKKKKKKDPETEPAPANPNFSPSPTDGGGTGDAAATEEPKKKKKKAADPEAQPDPTPAAEPANPNFSNDPPADDAGGKKKKKKKDKDSGSEDPFAEPTSP